MKERERAREIAMLKIKEAVLFSAIIVLLLSIAVKANPLGATDATVVSSERGNLSGNPDSVPAEAGNVTELLINGTGITKTWQGYFGNITGILTLDDGSNNTMYEWQYANPEGEIYATNDTDINWGNVVCFNMSNSTIVTGYEDYIGISQSDYDGINETFASQTHSSFYIGTRQIAANSCWSLKTYVGGSPQTTTSNFVEVALRDNSSNVVVFTTIINQSTIGFDNKAHDFQMIVPVKGGHDTPVTTDTFYFYVEI